MDGMDSKDGMDRMRWHGWDGWGSKAFCTDPPQSIPFLLKKTPPSTFPPFTYLTKAGGGVDGGVFFKGWGAGSVQKVLFRISWTGWIGWMGDMGGMGWMRWDRTDGIFMGGLATIPCV